MALKHPQFETFKGDDEQFYWHLIAKNAEPLGDGEGHSTRAKAKRAALTNAKRAAEAARFGVVAK